MAFNTVILVLDFSLCSFTRLYFFTYFRSSIFAQAEQKNKEYWKHCYRVAKTRWKIRRCGKL